MNKIYSKYSKKIKKILLIFLLLYTYDSYALEPIIDWCDELEKYVINDNNISGSDPYYITTINKDYDFNLSIAYEWYDCDNFDDFYLEIPGLPLHLACVEWWSNRRYRIGQIGMLKNMPKDTNYEIFLTQNVDDRRGIWKMFLCYNRIEKQEDKKCDDENILTWKNWFFETREDFITFMQIQLGLYLIWLILIMLYKILYIRR
jgi:hypothetical protein